MINLLIQFIVLLLLAYLVNYFLVQSFFGYKWRVFVAPGVIVHELSHAFGCLITGAKITKISLFSKDGGCVEHQKSPIPIFGPIIISMAPLIIGIIIFFFLAKIIHLENICNINSTFINIKSIYKNIDFTNWGNILIIYLLLSVAVTMTPSWQDLVNIIIPIIILVGIVYLLLLLHIIDFAIFDSLFRHLAPVVILSIIVLFGLLIVSMILYLITKVLKKQ